MANQKKVTKQKEIEKKNYQDALKMIYEWVLNKEISFDEFEKLLYHNRTFEV
jgi:hypothetical protein